MSGNIMCKALRVLKLAMELNPEGTQRESTSNKPTAFVDFSGHVGALSVRIFSNGWDGWNDNVDADIEYNIWFGWDDAEQRLDKAIETLEKLVKEWGVKNE